MEFLREGRSLRSHLVSQLTLACPRERIAYPLALKDVLAHTFASLSALAPVRSHVPCCLPNCSFIRLLEPGFVASAAEAVSEAIAEPAQTSPQALAAALAILQTTVFPEDGSWDCIVAMNIGTFEWEGRRWRKKEGQCLGKVPTQNGLCRANRRVAIAVGFM